MSPGVPAEEAVRLRRPREEAPVDTRAAPFLQRFMRYAAGALFILVGAAMIAAQTPIRAFEAFTASWLADLTYAQDARFTTSAGQPAVAFQVRDHWMVLRVTVQCAIAFYAAAIAMLGGFLVVGSRIRLTRIALATVTGIIGLTALNQLRLLIIGFAWGTWGAPGFSWAHGPIGTLMMLVGMAGALAGFFLIVVRLRRGEDSRPRDCLSTP